MKWVRSIKVSVPPLKRMSSFIPKQFPVLVAQYMADEKHRKLI